MWLKVFFTVLLLVVLSSNFSVTFGSTSAGGRYYIYIEPGFSWYICPAGSSFNWSTGWCELYLGVVCPYGMIYDPSRHVCYSSLTCPPGSTYDPTLDACVVPPIIRCAPGLEYSEAANLCYSPNPVDICRVNLNTYATGRSCEAISACGSKCTCDSDCVCLCQWSDVLYYIAMMSSYPDITELCIGQYEIGCYQSGKVPSLSRDTCPPGMLPVSATGLSNGLVGFNPHFYGACGDWVTGQVPTGSGMDALCDLLYPGSYWSGSDYLWAAYDGRFYYYGYDFRSFTDEDKVWDLIECPVTCDASGNYIKIPYFDNFCVKDPDGGSCPPGMVLKTIYQIDGEAYEREFDGWWTSAYTTEVQKCVGELSCPEPFFPPGTKYYDIIPDLAPGNPSLCGFTFSVCVVPNCK